MRAIVVPTRGFGNLQFQHRAPLAVGIRTDQIPPVFFMTCWVALEKSGVTVQAPFSSGIVAGRSPSIN